jgi:hypothetical protein
MLNKATGMPKPGQPTLPKPKGAPGAPRGR